MSGAEPAAGRPSRLRAIVARVGVLAAVALAPALTGGCGDDPPTPDAGETTGARFGGDRDRDGIRDGSLSPEEAATAPEADHLIVSIGDSVASGEGNPDVPGGFPTRPARWLQRRCHRSLLSGHAEAALLAERGDDATDVMFVPLGCSGATIREGLLGPYRGIQPERDELLEPGQVARVNALAELRDIDALLVSVGANDVHFSSVVKFCLAVRDCPSKRFDPDRPFAQAPRGTPALAEVVGEALGGLRGAYAELAAELSPKIEAERVLLVEYFDPTRVDDERFCRMEFLGEITPPEARWAHKRLLQPLNMAVRDAAMRHRWTLVDGVDEAFVGHGICAEGRERWVRTLPESLHRQDLNFAGTLHPNGAGHVETAKLIAPALAEALAAERGR